MRVWQVWLLKAYDRFREYLVHCVLDGNLMFTQHTNQILRRTAGLNTTGGFEAGPTKNVGKRKGSDADYILSVFEFSSPRAGGWQHLDGDRVYVSP